MKTCYSGIFAAFFFIPYSGSNIMLGKKTSQSNTVLPNYVASNANDGIYLSPGMVEFPSAPHPDTSGWAYWQGDLQGYYTVSNITVVAYSAWALNILDVVIGISLDDVSCPDAKTTECGKWPSVAGLMAQSFACPVPALARYIRITRFGIMGLSEVIVDGKPAQLPNIFYKKSGMLKRLSQVSKSLTVASLVECGLLCLNQQPCIAYSFRRQEQHNCLLATDNTTETVDLKWSTYLAKQCGPMNA